MGFEVLIGLVAKDVVVILGGCVVVAILTVVMGLVAEDLSGFAGPVVGALTAFIVATLKVELLVGFLIAFVKLVEALTETGESEILL